MFGLAFSGIVADREGGVVRRVERTAIRIVWEKCMMLAWGSFGSDAGSEECYCGSLRVLGVLR